MKSKYIYIIIIAAIIILGIGFYMKNKQTTVVLETNMGNIDIQLDQRASITSGNFESLVKSGFYNGIIFHRIVPGFVIQGGDPTGTGTGSSKEIKDEFVPDLGNLRGTISMANRGPNTGSSQFFINLADNNFLDGKHPVFGQVVSGMDVVDKIAAVKTNANGRPNNNVTIVKAYLK